ncbi:hypothetical protein LCGC14_0909680 [marine sediment metagenome]|uniref:Uncharacterized protein n=1 Tax=marine sediment metagenome TaxID=412755 RepID=A0A0F9NTZ9_9ZZZZ
MKLNNGEIFNAREPLGKLIEQKFPVGVSYGLAKMSSKLNDQLKVIDDVRNGLIRTYGKPDPENAQQIKVNPEGEDFQKFASELNELFSQEVEVVFEKVKLPEKVAATCDKCSHNMDKMLEIEPSVLMALDKFIEV